MSFVPSDFGGFVCGWHPDGSRAIVVRYGEGKPQEGLRLTPLNLLQLREALDGLIEQGEREGHITAEHRCQARQMPRIETPAQDMAERVLPRSEVDRIAGED